MKDDQILLTMTKAEYDLDADAYSENAFYFGFFEGVYTLRKLLQHRGISFPADLFDEALNLRKSIYDEIK